MSETFESLMEKKSFEFLLKFHEGIPRQGPGTPEATREAFRHIASLLPPRPAILDVGCGSGGQTLTLAGVTDGTILAVDKFPMFVEELQRAAAERGLSSRVTARVADMNALDATFGSFDLVWSEGALYIMGFENGLRRVRELLRGPALVGVTEAAWLRPVHEVPADVMDFWKDTYAAIQGVEETLEIARGAGYRVLSHFTLPPAAWAAYVDAVERRMTEVLARFPGDPDAEEAAEVERRELAMFRQNLRFFGYEFLLLQRA